jgi:hypothetical protein
MVVVALSAERRVALHRRALWLEYFTVGWNVVEAVVAIGAGVIAGSVALIGFGADSAIEVISAVGLLWRLRKAGHMRRWVRRAQPKNERSTWSLSRSSCWPSTSPGRP